MELSDAETTPKTIEKAAVWISRGLAYVAAENGLEAVQVVRRVSLERLFRVGANLDPERARGRASGSRDGSGDVGEPSALIRDD